MLDTLLWPLRPPQNWWVAYATLVGVLFLALQISAAVMVYAERKVAALMQQRYGPWLVGPRGLLQPIADIVKLFFKEELQPKAADRLLFSLAPIISVATCFIAFAPVPFGATTTFFGWLDEPIALQVADLNVGVLFVFAIASIGRLRHRAGRVGQQLEVLAARRPAQLGADDQLRAGLRHGPGHHRAAGRLDVVPRDRRRPGRLLLRARSRAGTCS